MENFDISLSKRIGGIASYITLKETDKRSINLLFSYIHIVWILFDNVMCMKNGLPQFKKNQQNI